MILCVDAGNTNVVFAVADAAGKFTHTFRIHTNDKHTADEYAAWLLPLLTNGGVKFADIAGVVISSVVPALDFALSRLAEKYMHTTAQFIGRDIHHNLQLNLAAGAKLGTDMAAGCVAALSYNKLPCVVVDFGTATTMQVLNKNGVQSGGVIAPGINLSTKALYQAAAKLPQVGFERTAQVIQKDTPSCMQSGIFWGYVSMVEGLLTRIETEMGEKPYIIATGGLAALIADALPRIDVVNVELTMRGIYLIYQQAQKK